MVLTVTATNSALFDILVGVSTTEPPLIIITTEKFESTVPPITTNSTSNQPDRSTVIQTTTSKVTVGPMTDVNVTEDVSTRTFHVASPNATSELPSTDFSPSVKTEPSGKFTDERPTNVSSQPASTEASRISLSTDVQVKVKPTTKRAPTAVVGSTTDTKPDTSFSSTVKKSSTQTTRVFSTVTSSTVLSTQTTSESLTASRPTSKAAASSQITHTSSTIVKPPTTSFKTLTPTSPTTVGKTTDASTTTKPREKLHYELLVSNEKW